MRDLCDSEAEVSSETCSLLLVNLEHACHLVGVVVGSSSWVEINRSELLSAIELSLLLVACEVTWIYSSVLCYDAALNDVALEVELSDVTLDYVVGRSLFSAYCLAKLSTEALNLILDHLVVNLDSVVRNLN